MDIPIRFTQMGMDLWGDDAAFCQITLTSCFFVTTEFVNGRTTMRQRQRNDGNEPLVLCSLHGRLT